MIDDENDTATFAVPDEAKSSARILAAISKAEDAFREWQAECDHIDQIYNRDGYGLAGRMTADSPYAWQDATLDLFWSSFEVMKPAIYARAPQPVVAPLFKDNQRAPNVAAELLERCAVSTFKRTNIDDTMKLDRDDLLFAGRATMWLRYDSGDGQKVCVDYKDRRDFLHEPTRTWAEVGWVAGASYLTRKEMRARFREHSGDAYLDAQFTKREDGRQDGLEDRAVARRCKVWEVWHKADNKVYWVTEGVDVLLDAAEPHLDLEGFFPAPKPAYATLRRRSLIPVPDWQRYAVHFSKISELTGRIYALLNDVKMKGLIPAGGEVGDVIEELVRSDDDRLLIPVTAATMLQNGATGFVAWLPLKEVAEAIQGLIAARAQLIDDFYQLSGISDIMRGATEAEETLGAQQLKSQYGSVRVREKSAELQRLAADAVKIAAEIIAQKFTRKSMLEMSRMDIPTRKAVEKRITDIEKAAEQEIKGLAKKAEQMARRQGGQPVDPQQAEAMFGQAQQQILARYAPMLEQAEQQVTIEEVEALLKDERTRCFTFEIESSSTILTDELQEKASRNEFLTEFTNASAGLMGLSALGEPGAKLAGAMMKFVLAPYRAGREMDGAIDEFIEAAPEMAKAAKGDEGDSEGLVEANKKLAEAEQVKAQAAMASVQAKAALDQAETQRKFAELQQRAGNDAIKAAQEAEKLRQQLAKMELDADKQRAEIDNLTANTARILASIGLDERKQQLSEYQAAEQAQNTRVDQAMAAENMTQDAGFRAADQERADRQQDYSERSGERQQAFAERQETNDGNG